MSTNQPSIENRIAQGTLGASLGAAGGAVVATMIGFALPAISLIVLLAPLVGAVVGLAAKELARRSHESENSEVP